MKIFTSTVIIFIVCLSCKKQMVSIKNSFADEPPQALISDKKKDTVAYFPNALTYQFQENGELKELWLYVNEATQEILYIPNDDMIQAIISYPDGTYKIFGMTERGEKQTIEQWVDVKSHSEIDSDVLKPLSEKLTISQGNIQQKDLECSSYYLKYLKMEGGETLFVTTQIPINSYQLYGFSKLDGDARLSVNIDFMNILKPIEIITHIDRDGFSLKLLNYGPNPYEFHLNSYQN